MNTLLGCVANVTNNARGTGSLVTFPYPEITSAELELFKYVISSHVVSSLTTQVIQHGSLLLA